MSVSASWDKTLADAKKILGASAKVNINKMQGALKDGLEINKAWTSFDSMLEGVKKKLLEVQNVSAKSKNSLRQAADELCDDDYGLDTKKPDDKKKVDQAQAVFNKFFQAAQKNLDDQIKTLDQLDKELISLAKHKRLS
jgi:hypothetical protein